MDAAKHSVDSFMALCTGTPPYRVATGAQDEQTSRKQFYKRQRESRRMTKKKKESVFLVLAKKFVRIIKHQKKKPKGM